MAAPGGREEAAGRTSKKGGAGERAKSSRYRARVPPAGSAPGRNCWRVSSAPLPSSSPRGTAGGEGAGASSTRARRRSASPCATRTSSSAISTSWSIPPGRCRIWRSLRRRWPNAVIGAYRRTAAPSNCYVRRRTNGALYSFRTVITSRRGRGSTAAAAAAAAHPHPVCNLCHSPYKDWEVSFEHWGLIDAVLQPLDLCTDCYRKSVPPSVDASSISIREKRVLDEYLFILMEYCEMTLSEAAAECRRRRTAEEEEEEDDDDRCDARLWSLFGQCVRGLAHLHSRGVVHRDIKPTNIFVLDGVAKIGDMGLATYSEGGGGGGGDSSSSSDVGTYLYMAPETKGGSYSDKSDVFALGVVLVETFSDFSTGMERAVVLEKFRADGTLPSDWEARRPVQADLARRMAAADPSARPSSGQILGELLREGLLGEQPDPAALVDAVTDLHEQLKTMQLKLQRIGEENSELRQLLDERGISHGHVGHINGSNSVGSKQRIKGC
uniref:Protein kinase domain-containing protein n=1 Tax=Odontella aurita TaxID=265563 RepID=A0A7S4MVH2_9STRA|mmetsp:Transcript_33585/g.100106  ORF Transcript_33585/g.100106 Transcript_33585/m.100106 type:complete len:496 (+) Transcript_33585:367-1854(+)